MLDRPVTGLRLCAAAWSACRIDYWTPSTESWVTLRIAKGEEPWDHETRSYRNRGYCVVSHSTVFASEQMHPAMRCLAPNWVSRMLIFEQTRSGEGF